MTNFPAKLHYLLGEMERDGQSGIMSWQPNGRSFVVHNKTRLEETILPHWFRQAKYSSFQRQLNIYGFQRISEGINKGGYQHEFFRRDQPELCANIPRCRNKGRMSDFKTSETICSHPDSVVVTTATQPAIPTRSAGNENEAASEFSKIHHDSNSMFLNAICSLAHIQQVNPLCQSPSGKNSARSFPPDASSKFAAPICNSQTKPPENDNE